MLPDQKTKIVAASESPDVMEAMIKAGMNIARINLAHGDLDNQKRVIGRLHTAAHSSCVIGGNNTIYQKVNDNN